MPYMRSGRYVASRDASPAPLQYTSELYESIWKMIHLPFMRHNDASCHIFNVEKLLHLARHGLHSICLEFGGLVCIAIAEQIWSDHPMSTRGEICDLMTPVVTRGWIAVKQEESEAPRSARLHGHVAISYAVAQCRRLGDRRERERCHSVRVFKKSLQECLKWCKVCLFSQMGFRNAVTLIKTPVYTKRPSLLCERRSEIDGSEVCL
jgi:hypothetical protein